MLKITDLSARVAGKDILKGVNLEVNAGEVHAIMGPNGSGKSTLAQVLAGREDYEVTGGSVTFDGRDLLAHAAEERARAGLFLGFQYPVEIPGVNNVYLLKAALNAKRKAAGEPEVDAYEFLALITPEDEAHADERVVPDPRRERGILRRRKEAQRSPADAGAGAEARDSRRDGFGPRHRCAQGGVRGREQPARPERAPSCW